jgi:hypothetical protein
MSRKYRIIALEDIKVLSGSRNEQDGYSAFASSELIMGLEIA